MSFQHHVTHGLEGDIQRPGPVRRAQEPAQAPDGMVLGHRLLGKHIARRHEYARAPPRRSARRKSTTPARLSSTKAATPAASGQKASAPEPLVLVRHRGQHENDVALLQKASSRSTGRPPASRITEGGSHGIKDPQPRPERHEQRQQRPPDPPPNPISPTVPPRSEAARAPVAIEAPASSRPSLKATSASVISRIQFQRQPPARSPPRAGPKTSIVVTTVDAAPCRTARV